MTLIRTYDGRGNNLSNPRWGSAITHLRRVSPADYGVTGSTGRVVNPRAISTRICRFREDRPSPENLTDFVWAWGQFLDHEIDLTPEHEVGQAIPIVVPAGEGPPGLPFPDLVAEIPFVRSEFDLNRFGEVATGANPCVSGQDVGREQINLLSSFIDGANVYGVGVLRATALRRLDGSGKMKTSAGNLLPFNLPKFANVVGPSPRLGKDRFFLAGDVRANEHVVLTSMHTIWVREHNRLCDDLVGKHPDWSDEQLYQAARKVVAAKMQVITYSEFLPALIGADAVPPYSGYDSTLDPSVANEFATAFYRLGHSMLSNSILAGDTGDSLELKDLFFDPQRVVDDGIEKFLGGLHQQRMQSVDVQLVDSVRQFLFNPPGFDVGAGNQFLDLAALNIQRGRDHGLPSYNACREAYGLEKKQTFDEISTNSELVAELRQVYCRLDSVDPWVGALAEDKHAGSAVGELIRAALAEQFYRLREGDRFWWENDSAQVLEGEFHEEIQNTTLGKVLNQNTSCTKRSFPDDVFHLEG